jgi:hypothetical protein
VSNYDNYERRRDNELAAEARQREIDESDAIKWRTIAPDLLEALRLTQAFFGNGRWFQDSGTGKEALMRKIDAAIDKATQ